MDSPAAWNIDDKSNSLSVDSDGLKVTYTGEIFIYNLNFHMYTCTRF